MPRVLRVCSRIRCLKRAMALGATRRRGSRSPVKLNPRNFLCTAHESRYLLAFPFIPLAGYRSGLPPFFWSNTPSADFCGTIRVHRFTLSHDSVTYRRSPEVSSTAFDAQPSDLPPVYLMDTGFAIIRSPTTVGLLSDSYSSARIFAPRFFQAPPRGESYFTLALRYHFTSITL